MNQGQLGGKVWPPYVGLATDEGEPFDTAGYERGMISWRVEENGIFGRAVVWVPKGVYTEIRYYSGPHAENGEMGDRQRLEHPVVFDRLGQIELDPIQDATYLPRWP